MLKSSSHLPGSWTQGLPAHWPFHQPSMPMYSEESLLPAVGDMFCLRVDMIVVKNLVTQNGFRQLAVIWAQQVGAQLLGQLCVFHYA